MFIASESDVSIGYLYTSDLSFMCGLLLASTLSCLRCLFIVLCAAKRNTRLFTQGHALSRYVILHSMPMRGTILAAQIPQQHCSITCRNELAPHTGRFRTLLAIDLDLWAWKSSNSQWSS